MPEADELKIMLRLPPGTAKRLDHYVAARNANGDGARISRNAAIAVLLEKALDQIPEMVAPKKKVAGRR